MMALGDVADDDVLIVHDAVRPLVSAESISDMIRVCKEHDNAMTVLDCADTMYMRQSPDSTSQVVERAGLVRGQTPECVSGRRMREMYARAAEQGIELIDCTCPVVLQLQRRIREAYARMQEAGGQVIIFGKVGHAEVLGLVGQVGGDALVVENMSMLSEAVDRGLVHPDGPVEVFSQTTKSPSEYAAICAALRSFVRGEVTVHDTICKQVSSRHAQLTAFARSHDVIIFVSGRESSNGKVLYGLCKGVNERSHQVGSAAEVDPSWLRDGDRVGVCGATSTPKWLLEAVAQKILHV
jgi:4-hydroxy-3-methylbut-2-enyl diphosphate reductase